MIALIFTFYIFSFFVDLYPAVRTRKSRPFRSPADRYSAGGNMEETTTSDGDLAYQHNGVHNQHNRDTPNGNAIGLTRVPNDF